MKLNAVRIPCGGLEESHRYYVDCIGWPEVFGSPEEGYIGFDLDGALALLEPEETGEFESGRYLGFSVSVPDLTLFYKEARKRGVSFTGSPEPQSWGGLMAHIIDNSGNTFSIVED